MCFLCRLILVYHHIFKRFSELLALVLGKFQHIMPSKHSIECSIGCPAQKIKRVLP